MYKKAPRGPSPAFWELRIFEANPHHRRAQLVVLTDAGRQAFEAAARLQIPWVNSLAKGLSVEDIETAHRVIQAVRGTLDPQ